jgi:hypothetical protein
MYFAGVRVGADSLFADSNFLVRSLWIWKKARLATYQISSLRSWDTKGRSVDT